MIRTARQDDLDAILGALGELGRPCGTDTRGPKREVAAEILDRADTRVLIAEDGDLVIGMASLLFLARLGHSRPEARLLDLVVSKDARTKGVGRALVHSATDLAIGEGCRLLRLECGHWRKGAQLFYERLGFESKGEDLQLTLAGDEE